jgi:decaprenylphospho-beta-D-ribofuranose 2-oxidase
MRLSEPAQATDRDPPAGSTPMRLHGWGGGHGVQADVLAIGDELQLTAVLAQTDGPVICRGMGRSYGDAAQCDGGLVLDLRPCRQTELDAELGTLRAGAGATLAQLLDELAPTGWILPVVPGTQHVTVGGAIACDIHGKNHGTAGSIGRHVRSLGLVTATGESLELSREHRPELLEATIGGMGLTGVVTWAEIELVRAPVNAELRVNVDRADDLDGALALLDSTNGGPHRVAWLDLLSRRLARGVVTRAAIVGPADGPAGGRRPASAVTVGAKARVPAWWPSGALRPETVRAFNARRFASAPRVARGRRERYGAHMFALDALDAWPRLYGPSGLVQYQCVVPRGRERELQLVLERLRAAPPPCYLAVLKDFGAESPSPLSFPLRGWTLALDMPRRAAGLAELLAELDRIVVEAGGRVYLAKDARLDAETTAAMYPRLPQWRAVRDRVDPERRWQSDLARRTGLVDA